MAPLVIPPGYAQFNARFSLTGDPEEMVTTCGAELSGSFTANEYATAWAGGILELIDSGANMLDEYTFVGVDAYIGQDGGPPLVGVYNTPQAGLATTGGPVPQNSAFLVRKSTALAGRRNMGRFYFPPLFAVETEVSPNGVLSPAAVTAIQGWLDGWFTFLTAVESVTVPVLFHSAAPTTPTPITGFVLDSLLATQRQRLRR